MISYVEVMIKISEDFVHVVTYDAYKPGQLGKEDFFIFFKKIPLCRVPPQGHSAKTFKKKIFAEC